MAIHANNLLVESIDLGGRHLKLGLLDVIHALLFLVVISVHINHAFWNQDITKAKKFMSAGMY